MPIRKMKKGKRMLCFLVALSLFVITVTFPLSKNDEGGYLAAIASQSPSCRRYSTQQSYVTLPSLSSLPDTLIVGGCAFGIRMSVGGVWVIGFADMIGMDGQPHCPARECGLKKGDLIIEVNGQPIDSADLLTQLMEQSGGKTIALTVSRDGTKCTIRLTPIKSSSDGVYRAGFFIRDNTSGIGTLTYIDPTDYDFGGLGHGVCDSDSGRLLPCTGGIVSEVSISGVNAGKAGDPGEIKGSLRSIQIGALRSNTAGGVFGTLSSVPIACKDEVAVAEKDQIKVGKATIRCTLDDGGICEYEIRIDKIHMEEGQLKNFEITVTDPDLLAKTGGIVQGMSGSPIIQDGRLIGAVTHVLVNDPSKGYGIYIGNMLRLSEV